MCDRSGLFPAVSRFCTSCDIQRRQRLVVAMGGNGGSEDLSCIYQIYRPFAHFVPLGTKVASSGQKLPLKPKHVWAIRVRLELAENHRDLALFNMAIDSKLRGCDLVRMKVVDVMASGQIKARASVLQSKTQKPVRFEILEGTRASVATWMKDPLMVGSEFLWSGRFHERLHISTRQYARIVRDWVSSIGLEVTAYGTHSMRRTKVTQIYKKTGNLRAVQLLLGHTKMDSTVRYLGVELEDALAIAEAIEI
jgi:site-specific recombinase XerC